MVPTTSATRPVPGLRGRQEVGVDAQDAVQTDVQRRPGEHRAQRRAAPQRKRAAARN